MYVYCLSLQHVFDIVILDFNVFRSVMKHRVLRELYTALVITMNSSRIHLMIEQVSQNFLKPYCFTTITLNAIYSASAILNATKFCFLLHQETIS